MWALNALSCVGNFEYSGNVIIGATQNYGESKQVLVSAASCIYSLCRDAEKVVRTKTHIDPNTAYLAACRVSSWENLSFPPPPILIDTALPDDLKSALILVGTERAPPALFHPHHTNKRIIEELFKHDDPIVRQYCFWALCENDTFDFMSLPSNMKNIGNLSDNVRVWAYHLAGKYDLDLPRRLELLKDCSRDAYPKARLGLAKGIKGSYFDGLENIVVDWFQDEVDAEVRLRLLEHMALFSEETLLYDDYVCSFYGSGQLSAHEKEHILEAASQKALYPKLKKIMGQSDPMFDFGFDGRTLVSVNIGGNNNAPINIAGRDITQTANISLNPEQVKELETNIAEVELILDEPDVQGLVDEQAADVKALISEVRKEPKLDKVKKLVDGLAAFNESLDKITPLKDKAKKLLPFVVAIKTYFGFG